MTTKSGLYGNENETFYVNAAGTVYLIQGPDMRPGERFQQCRSLPADAEPLSDSITTDIEVPEECLAAKILWSDLTVLDEGGNDTLGDDEQRAALAEFRRTDAMVGRFFARIDAPHEVTDDASTWGPQSAAAVDWTGFDGTLYDSDTAEEIGPATREQREASEAEVAAGRHEGHIMIDDAGRVVAAGDEGGRGSLRRVYVQP